MRPRRRERFSCCYKTRERKGDKVFAWEYKTKRKSCHVEKKGGERANEREEHRWLVVVNKGQGTETRMMERRELTPQREEERYHGGRRKGQRERASLVLLSCCRIWKPSTKESGLIPRMKQEAVDGFNWNESRSLDVRSKGSFTRARDGASCRFI